jgi:hypothetical protein
MRRCKPSSSDASWRNQAHDSVHPIHAGIGGGKLVDVFNHSSDILITARCQGKVEMSYSLQSRNVRFWPGGETVHVNLGVPVKRRRAMLASSPIEE